MAQCVGTIQNSRPMGDRSQERKRTVRERIRSASERALQEAEERRGDAPTKSPPANERGGPAAPEPTRFGDWERKGIASDF